MSSLPDVQAAASRRLPVIRPQTAEERESEVWQFAHRLGYALQAIIDGPGVPPWARKLAREARWGSGGGGYGVPDGAPLPFPADMHVLMVEHDNPGHDDSRPIIWETNASASGAPSLESAMAMADRQQGRYGRWIVAKLVPVASSGPEGWVEVDRAGEPVRRS